MIFEFVSLNVYYILIPDMVCFLFNKYFGDYVIVPPTKWSDL